MRSFLSIRETADVLGVQYKTVCRLIRDGELPAAKIRSVYRIKYEDLLSYFDAQKAALRGRSAPCAADPEPIAQGQS